MARFSGMVGNALAQQRLSSMVESNKRLLGQMKSESAGVNQNSVGGHSGIYLFIPNPNCCKKCSLLGQTPHFFNTPDVAYITHPNCKCATMEAPAGLSPAELMEWAQHPVGQLRYGWNYGQSFAPVKITEKNRFDKMLAFGNRVRPTAGSPRTRRKVRVSVTEEQIKAAREAYKSGAAGKAKDLTESLLKEKPRLGAGDILRMRRAERALKALMAKQAQEPQKPLRKGNHWNPNAGMPKRRTKVSKSVGRPEAARKLMTRLPKSSNVIRMGGSGIAMTKFDEEKKRKKRLEKTMKKLGYI